MSHEFMPPGLYCMAMAWKRRRGNICPLRDTEETRCQ